MKIHKALILVTLLFAILAGCQFNEEENPSEPILMVSQHGISMEITDTAIIENNLMITFEITEEYPADTPLFRIRMPWYVVTEGGQKIASSSSAFYNGLDENKDAVPGVSRLEVTFRDYQPEEDALEVLAKIEPLFLIPAEDGYFFEVTLNDLIPESNQQEIAHQLGFTLLASATRPQEDTLHVSVKVTAPHELLQSFSYAVQPIAYDDSGRSYISDRSERRTQEPDYREETLIFEGVDPSAKSFTLNYPVQVKATLPNEIEYRFTHVPVDR